MVRRDRGRIGGLGKDGRMRGLSDTEVLYCGYRAFSWS